MALSQRVKRRLQAYATVIVGGIVLALTCSAVVFAATSSSSGAVTIHSVASADANGPYVTMRVPAVCAFPQTDLRYHNDVAPAGSVFLRSGAHGHGGYLRCIYFAVTGPPSALVGDHPYGKWLVFTANHGLGLLIPLSGIEADYVNCKLPGYHFPFPVGNGQPNDCGESWLPGNDELAQYLYKDNTAGDIGKTMFPPTLP